TTGLPCPSRRESASLPPALFRESAAASDWWSSASARETRKRLPRPAAPSRKYFPGKPAGTSSPDIPAASRKPAQLGLHKPASRALSAARGPPLRSQEESSEKAPGAGSSSRRSESGRQAASASRAS